MANKQKNRSLKPRRFKAAWRLFGLFVITLYYLISHGYKTFSAKHETRYQVLSIQQMQKWSNAILRFLNIQLKIFGDLPNEGTLVTPNHQSYLDILALSSASPMVFLSKAEVSSWPFIGFLLKRAAQLTITRGRKKSLNSIVSSIHKRLSNDQSVCVFLEGTTSNGKFVSKFHTSLLEAAIAGNHPIVPTAVRWHAVDERISISEDIAYWKDHRFPAHVWRLLGLSGIKVSVFFGDSFSPRDQNRRELGQKVHEKVVDQFNRLGVS